MLQPEVHGGPSSTYPVRMLLPHLTLVLDLAGKEPRQAIFRAQTLTHLNRTVTTGGVSSLKGWVTRLGQKGTRKEPNLISPRGTRLRSGGAGVASLTLNRCSPLPPGPYLHEAGFLPVLWPSGPAHHPPLLGGPEVCWGVSCRRFWMCCVPSASAMGSQ